MKLLLVEDEPMMQTSVSSYLGRSGWLVQTAGTYREGEEKLSLYSYDCVLLDVTLPGGSGLDLLRLARLRMPETPVLILSARNSIEDRLKGFELGADDYLPKPFHLAELEARVKSLLRRHQRGGRNEVSVGCLSVLPDESVVEVSGVPLTLTPKEFELMHFFLLNPGKVLSKSALAEHLWGDEMDAADSHDFLYSHIKNLRKKISHAGGGDPLKTIYGMGYKLVSE